MIDRLKMAPFQAGVARPRQASQGGSCAGFSALMRKNGGFPRVLAGVGLFVSGDPVTMAATPSIAPPPTSGSGARPIRLSKSVPPCCFKGKAAFLDSSLMRVCDLSN
jgi:hypothetical protein